MTVKDILKEIGTLSVKEAEQVEARFKDEGFWDELHEQEAFQEAARRGDELTSGKVKGLPMDAAFFKRMRSKLKWE